RRRAEPVSVVVPSTSGAWCAALPSAVGAGLCPASTSAGELSPNTPPPSPHTCHSFADTLGRGVSGEQVGERGEPGGALADLRCWQLAVHAGCLGAVLIRVTENADRVETGVGEESLQLCQVCLGLAREPDDEIRANPGRRAARRA